MMDKQRYEIIEPLGCGATSRVDLARDTVIGRTVAIKTFVHSFGSALDQKHFLREAQIVGRLSHPSIVALYDVGLEPQGVAYLVMEYVPGKTLQEILSEGPLPYERACIWAGDLASALGRAHRVGIIHGDVKPANILVTEEGLVKLGDFGIARFATQVSGSGSLMGTPAYLSPEQIHGHPQNTKSDLFSLGIVLYQMLTGVRPFEGTSIEAVCAQILAAQPLPPSHHNRKLPPQLDHIVMRCLSKDPNDRYSTGEILASSLYPLARRPVLETAKLRRPGLRSWWTRPARFRDLYLVAALAVSVAAFLLVIQPLLARFRIPPPPASIAKAPRAPEPLSAENTESTQLPAENDLQTDSQTKDAKAVSTPLQKSHRHSDTYAKVTKLPGPDGPVLPPPSAKPNADSPVSTNAAAQPSPAVERAGLHIQITSTVAEGTLAIYADQKLICTTALHPGLEVKPILMDRDFTAGAHDFRVALYRTDKSLQTEKQGLAELVANESNVLGIRVNRHSKYLLRREPALEITWPLGESTSAKTPDLSSTAANHR